MNHNPARKQSDQQTSNAGAIAQSAQDRANAKWAGNARPNTLHEQVAIWRGRTVRWAISVGGLGTLIGAWLGHGAHFVDVAEYIERHHLWEIHFGKAAAAQAQTPIPAVKLGPVAPATPGPAAQSIDPKKSEPGASASPRHVKPSSHVAIAKPEPLNAASLDALGRMYRRENNYGLALTALTHAWKLGYAPAAAHIGFIYEQGKLPGNDRIMVSWYSKGYATGDAAATYRLGLAFLAGRGEPIDHIEGCRLLHIAQKSLKLARQDYALNKCALDELKGLF